jgi:hypothetical protein
MLPRLCIPVETTFHHGLLAKVLERVTKMYTIEKIFI